MDNAQEIERLVSNGAVRVSPNQEPETKPVVSNSGEPVKAKKGSNAKV
jgi:hypothetical protein